MLRFKNQVTFGVFLLVLISCTIVKDSDVTSLDQLNNLKLTSIEIVQNLNSGASSTKAVVEDSLYKTAVQATIDIDGKISGLVAKQTSIIWPVIAKTKMIFRSKVSSTGIVIKNNFYQNGKPRSSSVYENGQLKEWYSFYYDNNYKLTYLRSRIYLSVPKADTIITKDSLIYGTSGIELGHITGIFRKFPVTNSSVTIHFPYTNTYGGNVNLGVSNSGGGNTTYGSYQYNYGNCLCPSNSNNSCFGCDAQLSSSQGSSPTSHYLIEGQQVSNLLSQLEITDVKVNTNGSCGQSGSATNYDTYYYHPLMLLRGFFTYGDILLNIYAIDWLSPGSTTSINVSINETVTLNFNYAH
jgi:hypothetical protein